MPRPKPLALAATAVLLALTVPWTTDMAAEWLWFREVGYSGVLSTTLWWQGVAGVAGGLVALLWLTLHVRVATRALPVGPRPVMTRDGLTMSLPGRREIAPLATALAGLGAMVVALIAAGSWQTLAGWRHAVPSGTADPILGLDLSFYLFTLPLLALVRTLALLLVALAAGGVTLIYVLAGEAAMTPFGARLGPRARRHLLTLAAAGFLVLAVGAWLDRPQALVSPSGIIHGPGYTDVHARMPAALALTAASLAAAALAAAQAASGRPRLLLAGAALYGAVLLGGQVYATGVQRFVVAPNEQVREMPFIAHNIAATRRAFALDRIEEREITGDAALTPQDIANNRATLDNVRLWDHQPLLETFGQIQEIRTYYDFMAVDNDRYRIGGQLRQVMLSARELNPDALPNRTWVNERLTFTHGHGVTLGPVNQVTNEGLPELFIRDLPPVSTIDLPVTEPSIYFGELSNEYAIVRTRAREFHYPKGEDNVYTTYDGRGGVALDSFWRTLLFAVRFGSYQLLLSDDITPESRVIFDRQIRRRAAKVAPFLTFDDDPYLVVADGRLFWILDAYTTTDHYPYATPTAGGISYIRNAAKVVVDAYHGDVRVYLADAEDPIAATWARVFPGLFTPIDEMPESLRSHVRYPEGIFGMQASVFATYHMTNPAVFYNKEDQWEVPVVEEGAQGQSVRMQPYYTIMKVPGSTEAEFIQMLPFTPRRRDNLASWMVARSDGPQYGQLVVFQFPKQKLVFGPQQVVARINQDQAISPQITLWNQQGSEVIQGTLMVIPVEESLLYVRPLYLRAQSGRIPELRRVIVAYQNQIVMERTLDEALARIFTDAGSATTATTSAAATSPPAPGAAQPPSDRPSAPAGAGPSSLAAEARAAYDRATDAQRAGDWARYGDELRRLGDLLARMAADGRATPPR